jgi:hypothetical protein
MRLNEKQKRQAVFTVMSSVPYAMTANGIGKRIGFKTGRPLVGMLCAMDKAGEVNYWRNELNTGTEIFLWVLSAKGRQAAYDEFGVRPFDSPNYTRG